MADGNVQIVQADGTLPAAAAGGGFTLLPNVIYYAMFGNGDGATRGVQILAAAAVILTSVKIEDTVFLDAESLVSNDGKWVPLDDENAYVPTVGADMSVVNMTVAKAAGALGSAIFHVGNSGAVRSRLAIAVGAAGGVVQVGTHGKG